MSESPTVPLRCSCRRKAVTNLRCARCNTPICPDCSVIAPAGMLCRDCASTRRSPLFQVSLGSLALAYLACLIAASIGGWLLLTIGVGFGIFGLFLAYFYGLAVAEVALRVTGRKRGTKVEALAGICAAAGIIVGEALHLLGLSSIPAPMLRSVIMHSMLNPWLYIHLGIGVFAAVQRIRYI